MNKLSLIIGAICGLIAVVLTNLHISDIEENSKAVAFLSLAPEVALKKGDFIEDSSLRSKLLPAEFKQLEDIYIQDTDQNRELLNGQPVNDDLAGGSLLEHRYIGLSLSDRFASQIEVGKRAYTINTNSSSAVGYFIEPGSRVDVIGTFEGAGIVPNDQSGEFVKTQTFMQNLKVLAVGRATTRAAYEAQGDSGFGSITLELSIDEVETLLYAEHKAQGNLTFVLRNPADDENLVAKRLSGQEALLLTDESTNAIDSPTPTN